jgi:hypothetical protein
VAPLSYFVGIETDCREGSTTKCTLPVGKTRAGNFNFAEPVDSDWFRVTAEEGRRYTVSMTVDISGELSVRNRRGNVIGTCSADCQLKFKARYSGPYFVIAAPEDEDSGNYTLRLTRP